MVALPFEMAQAWCWSAVCVPELKGAAWWLPQKTPGPTSLVQAGVRAAGREFNVNKSTIHIRSGAFKHLHTCVRVDGNVSSGSRHLT